MREILSRAGLRLSYQFEVALVRKRGGGTRRIPVGAIDGVSLRPQVRQHVVAAAGFPLMAERADVDRCHHDPLAGPGRGLREHAPVEVDDLAAAGPGIRRIVPQAPRLLWTHDVI